MRRGRLPDDSEPMPSTADAAGRHQGAAVGMRSSPVRTRPWGKRKPKTRGQCIGRPRPCPWVRCRYHLAVECRGDAPESCALDVADAGAASQVEIARLLGVTKQRAEQLERAALAHARALLAEQGIREPSDLAPEHFDYPARPGRESIQAGIAAGAEDMVETDTGNTSGATAGHNDAAQDAA